MKYNIGFNTLLIALLTLAACEPKSTQEPTPTENVSNDPVGVLNENAGFTQFHDRVKNLQGIGTAIGVADIFDFSVEANNNFNYAGYTTFQSQQSNLISRYRYSINMDTKLEVPLPQYGSKDIESLSLSGSNLSVAYVAYRPYSNFLSYCVLGAQSSGINTKLTAEFYGDMVATIPFSYEVLGIPDLSYKFPVMNTIPFQSNATTKKEVRKGFAMSGYPGISYLYKVCTPYKFQYSFDQGHLIKYNLLDESDVKASNLHYSFDLRDDSLTVSTVNLPSGVNDNTAFPTITKIGGAAILNSFDNSGLTTLRHYSTDGKIFGMLFHNQTTNKYSTYSYNYTTNVLSIGLQNVALNYSATGSDVDLDEYGNIYYSGIANNGANTSGVSIYKLGVDNVTTLIGKDNFLKFGEIIKLKYQFGKVYMAVRGRISGTYNIQISFLKQD